MGNIILQSLVQVFTKVAIEVKSHFFFRVLINLLCVQSVVNKVTCVVLTT